MIDYLIELLIPLTVMLALILVLHKFLLTSLGANKVYALWLAVPIGLLAFSLPVNWFDGATFANIEIQRYIVSPTATIQQSFVKEWLMATWALFVSLLLSYWFLSHLLFKNNLSLKEVNLVLQQPLPKKLSAYISAHAYSPMLIGLFKQKLILPEDFTLLYNDEQQRLIVEHEICHFDRNDIYWNLIAFVLLALFWFHPLAWLAYFRFRRDQELSCDQTVLARKRAESRINYSKALLVAAETAPPLAFAQLSFKKYGDKEIMFERIKQIKKNTHASKLSISLASLLSVTLVSGLSYAGNVGLVGDSGFEGKKVKDIEGLHPIVRIEPKYPIQAAQENVEGSVVLKFDVNAAGNVENVSVINAIPEDTFNKEARRALKQWQYNANGSVHKDLLVQLDFRMDKDSTFKDVNLIEKIKVTQ